jgi:hypothetical protein
MANKYGFARRHRGVFQGTYLGIPLERLSKTLSDCSRQSCQDSNLVPRECTNLLIVIMGWP